MKLEDDPCYKCQDRVVGCHSSCEKYINWSSKVKEFNNAIKEKKKVMALAAGIGIDSHRRNLKKQHTK